MTRRCDLHVHSKRSDRPGEWYLERLGAPESFTEPLEVHRLARARGMDFVTVSDHDTIDGALEIAHLPGVFLSCEITAAFPEDGAPGLRVVDELPRDGGRGSEIEPAVGRGGSQAREHFSCVYHNVR